MDRWDGGNSYDVFMGRWSRLVAARFIRQLAADQGLRWLDVGCGTGALLETVAGDAQPRSLVGVEPSPQFAEVAQSRLGEAADIHVADGAELPFTEDEFDMVVSGLVLNFIPDPLPALREWMRVTTSGGTVGAYVWDYEDGMEFIRYFWDAAIHVDDEARHLDEGRRFPLCQPDRLGELFGDAGLAGVETDSIEVTTSFADFDDFWSPFLLGQGPAPSFVAGLGEPRRMKLEDRLRETVPTGPAGAIDMKARAWTVRGIA